VTSWEFNGLTEREKSIAPPNWQMSFSFLRTGQCSSWLRPKIQKYDECESATVGYGQRLQEWAQKQYCFYWLRQTTPECRVHVTCILKVKQVQGRFNGNWHQGEQHSQWATQKIISNMRLCVNCQTFTPLLIKWMSSFGFVVALCSIRRNVVNVKTNSVTTKMEAVRFSGNVGTFTAIRYKLEWRP
jgi:hypothetical protein